MMWYIILQINVYVMVWLYCKYGIPSLPFLSEMRQFCPGLTLMQIKLNIMEDNMG